MVYLDYKVTLFIDGRVAIAMITILAENSEHGNEISLRPKQENGIGKIANQILKEIKKAGLASQDLDTLIEVSNTKSG